ncbi:MAG: Gfo/Idh/MocA family oxidoreductase [Thermoguttaceae bacterium]|jgi:predicted dehydrogenase|nr:Gfo/Idh/MocA family oxidoreductase [Thermoguttaceae bacterium]
MIPSLQNQQRKTVRLSRRHFVAGILAAAAGPQLIPASALGKDGQMPPSERITIAMFGVGNRGTSSLGAMRPLPDHQVVAIADCRRTRAELAQQRVNEVYAARLGKQDYSGCEIYNDFRDVLARDDVNVIWGCVPDHWHGVVYNRAIEAGMDLYGEKPITRWIAEGIRVRDAVRRYGCVFQTGTQQRSQKHFRHACELARNGYLGKVHTVEVGAPGGRAYPAVAPSDPPEGFDYDMWTGPAPYFPFDTSRCEWLAMYMISHYCAGFITNWGVHHLDIAGWGCPEVFKKPFEVEGTGELPAEGMTDTWISWNMDLRWESGLKMGFSNSGGPYKQGCRFVGEDGWVHVNRAGISAEPESLLTVQLKPTDTPLHASPSFDNPYTAHTADFFQCIRTRRDPVSPVEDGQAASTLGNVCDISLRLGRKLTWDTPNDRFVGDDDANAMLSRAARSPWSV